MLYEDYDEKHEELDNLFNEKVEISNKIWREEKLIKEVDEKILQEEMIAI